MLHIGKGDHLPQIEIRYFFAHSPFDPFVHKAVNCPGSCGADIGGFFVLCVLGAAAGKDVVFQNICHIIFRQKVDKLRVFPILIEKLLPEGLVKLLFAFFRKLLPPVIGAFFQILRKNIVKAVEIPVK